MLTASWLLVFAPPLSAAVAPATAPAPASPRSVLALYGNDRLLPANLEHDRGLREALEVDGAQVMLMTEFLDQPQFQGPAYEATMATFLREKYAAAPPAVIVVAGVEALQFVLRNRAELFPRVPVVHGGVRNDTLEKLGPLPADVIGIPHRLDVSRTLGLALRLHPAARRIVIVNGDATTNDRFWDTDLRGGVTQFAGRPQVEFLTGLPHAKVLQRLASLPADSVVLTPGYFQDGDGRVFRPLDVIRDMARVSSAPIYAPYDTFIGAGIVGGYTRSFRTIGRESGEIVRSLLQGVDVPAVRLPTAAAPKPYIDWRQVKRWRIDPAKLPADAIIQFREPTILEAYGEYVTMGLVVVLVEALLILGLLTERFRRRRAEQAVMVQRFALAHAARLAVAGELTAAIAHEINQPLGAILSNADAAEMILESDGDRAPQLREILGDIRRDDLRASEVVRRLRTLLARQEVERRPLDMNLVVKEAVDTLRSEAVRRRMVLEQRLAPAPLMIEGDSIQLQQVLLNLMLNAMDAMIDQPPERRIVAVMAERRGARVCVEVRDRGRGIPPELLPRLFESFFTTKRKGMGLGLSIARTIIESQDGEITVDNQPGEGAAFQVWLPAAAPQAAPVAGTGPATAARA